MRLLVDRLMIFGKDLEMNIDDMMNMELHDVMDIDELSSMQVICVPGGWLYYDYSVHNPTMAFVPKPNYITNEKDKQFIKLSKEQLERLIQNLNDLWKDLVSQDKYFQANIVMGVMPLLKEKNNIEDHSKWIYF